MKHTWKNHVQTELIEIYFPNSDIPDDILWLVLEFSGVKCGKHSCMFIVSS